MELVLKSSVSQDRYTDYIQKTFDLAVSDVAEVHIPNNLYLDRLSNWNIGVICGASGSGKSSILRTIGEIKIGEFDNNKPLISNFDNMEPEQAANLLSSMGLASVPTWIRPFSSLSNGEKYRAEMAKILSTSGDDIVLIDEYTSVVDRNVAKSMSNALQKYIRRNNKRIILASCHYDIFDWLQPDWIYDLNKGGRLEKGDYLRQGRPQIQLQVYRTEYDTWHWFKKHHYMTANMNTSAACFCFTWNDQLVAFVGTLPLISGSIQNGIRGSRTVVLPDFQGFGFGSKLTEFIAGVYKSCGYSYYTKTVNPRLGVYRNLSEKWQATTMNEKETTEKQAEYNLSHGYLIRKSYCHKYIGEPVYGFENLIQPIAKMRYARSMKGQLSLFNFDD